MKKHGLIFKSICLVVAVTFLWTSNGFAYDYLRQPSITDGQSIDRFVGSLVSAPLDAINESFQSAMGRLAARDFQAILALAEVIRECESRLQIPQKQGYVDQYKSLQTLKAISQDSQNARDRFLSDPEVQKKIRESDPNFAKILDKVTIDGGKAAKIVLDWNVATANIFSFYLAMVEAQKKHGDKLKIVLDMGTMSDEQAQKEIAWLKAATGLELPYITRNMAQAAVETGALALGSLRAADNLLDRINSGTTSAQAPPVIGRDEFGKKVFNPMLSKDGLTPPEREQASDLAAAQRSTTMGGQPGSEDTAKELADLRRVDGGLPQPPTTEMIQKFRKDYAAIETLLKDGDLKGAREGFKQLQEELTRGNLLQTVVTLEEGSQHPHPIATFMNWLERDIRKYEKAAAKAGEYRLVQRWRDWLSKRDSQGGKRGGKSLVVGGRQEAEDALVFNSPGATAAVAIPAQRNTVMGGKIPKRLTPDEAAQALANEAVRDYRQNVIGEPTDAQIASEMLPPEATKGKEGKSFLEGTLIAAVHYMWPIHVGMLIGIIYELLRALASGVPITWTHMGVMLIFDAIVTSINWLVVSQREIARHERGHLLHAIENNILKGDLLGQAKAELEKAKEERLGYLKYRVKTLWQIIFNQSSYVFKDEHGGRFVPLNVGSDIDNKIAGIEEDLKSLRIAWPLGVILAAASMPFVGTGDLHGFLSYLVEVAAIMALSTAVVNTWTFFRADEGAYKYRRQRIGLDREDTPKEQLELQALIAVNRPIAAKRWLTVPLYVSVSPDGKIRIEASHQQRNTVQGGEHVKRGNITGQEFKVHVFGSDAEDAQALANDIQNRAIEIMLKDKTTTFVGTGIEGGIEGSFDRFEAHVFEVLIRAARDLGCEPGGLNKSIPGTLDELNTLESFKQLSPDDPKRKFIEKECFDKKGNLIVNLDKRKKGRLLQLLRGADGLGWKPGFWVDIDVAASSFNDAYREQTGRKDEFGMYRFYRRPKPVDFSSLEMIKMYVEWMQKYPILAIEDGLGENDSLWPVLKLALGLFNVRCTGDDYVTTDAESIARALMVEDLGKTMTEKQLSDHLNRIFLDPKVVKLAESTAKSKDVEAAKKIVAEAKALIERAMQIAKTKGLVAMDTTLIKTNQIGSVTETLDAMNTSRTAVVNKRTRKIVKIAAPVVNSHRSKAGVDAIEPENTGAMNMWKVGDKVRKFIQCIAMKTGGSKLIERTHKYFSFALNFLMNMVGLGYKKQEANEISDFIAQESPTSVGQPTVEVILFMDNNSVEKCIVPIGSSAGVREARHIVDGIKAVNDGKGCLYAIANINDIIFPALKQKKISDFKNVHDIDRFLLGLELKKALEELDSLAKLNLKSEGLEEVAVNSATFYILEQISAMRGKEFPEIDELIKAQKKFKVLSRFGNDLTLELNADSTAYLNTAKAFASELLKSEDQGGLKKSEKVRIMKRKAFLGMNAIMPVSVVLMRAVAKNHGMTPEEFMHDTVEIGIDRNYLYGFTDKPGAPSPVIPEEVAPWDPDWVEVPSLGAGLVDQAEIDQALAELEAPQGPQPLPLGAAGMINYSQELEGGQTENWQAIAGELFNSIDKTDSGFTLKDQVAAFGKALSFFEPRQQVKKLKAFLDYLLFQSDYRDTNRKFISDVLVGFAGYFAQPMQDNLLSLIAEFEDGLNTGTYIRLAQRIIKQLPGNKVTLDEPVEQPIEYWNVCEQLQRVVTSEDWDLALGYLKFESNGKPVPEDESSLDSLERTFIFDQEAAQKAEAEIQERINASVERALDSIAQKPFDYETSLRNSSWKPILDQLRDDLKGEEADSFLSALLKFPPQQQVLKFKQLLTYITSNPYRQDKDTTIMARLADKLKGRQQLQLLDVVGKFMAQDQLEQDITLAKRVIKYYIPHHSKKGLSYISLGRYSIGEPEPDFARAPFWLNKAVDDHVVGEYKLIFGSSVDNSYWPGARKLLSFSLGQRDIASEGGSPVREYFVYLGLNVQAIDQARNQAREAILSAGGVTHLGLHLGGTIYSQNIKDKDWQTIAKQFLEAATKPEKDFTLEDEVKKFVTALKSIRLTLSQSTREEYLRAFLHYLCFVFPYEDGVQSLPLYFEERVLNAIRDCFASDIDDAKTKYLGPILQKSREALSIALAIQQTNRFFAEAEANSVTTEANSVTIELRHEEQAWRGHLGSAVFNNMLLAQLVFGSSEPIKQAMDAGIIGHRYVARDTARPGQERPATITLTLNQEAIDRAKLEYEILTQPVSLDAKNLALRLITVAVYEDDLLVLINRTMDAEPIVKNTIYSVLFPVKEDLKKGRNADQIVRKLMSILDGKEISQRAGHYYFKKQKPAQSEHQAVSGPIQSGITKGGADFSLAARTEHWQPVLDQMMLNSKEGKESTPEFITDVQDLQGVLLAQDNPGETSAKLQSFLQELSRYSFGLLLEFAGVLEAVGPAFAVDRTIKRETLVFVDDLMKKDVYSAKTLFKAANKIPIPEAIVGKPESLAQEVFERSDSVREAFGDLRDWLRAVEVEKLITLQIKKAAAGFSVELSLDEAKISSLMQIAGISESEINPPAIQSGPVKNANGAGAGDQAIAPAPVLRRNPKTGKVEPGNLKLPTGELPAKVEPIHGAAQEKEFSEWVAVKSTLDAPGVSALAASVPVVAPQKGEGEVSVAAMLGVAISVAQGKEPPPESGATRRTDRAPWEVPLNVPVADADATLTAATMAAKKEHAWRQ